jgi:hypothetical protein
VEPPRATMQRVRASWQALLPYLNLRQKSGDQVETFPIEVSSGLVLRSQLG